MASQELARHKAAYVERGSARIEELESELRISNQRAHVATEDAALWGDRYDAANADAGKLREAMHAQMAAYTELNSGVNSGSYDELQRQFESVTRQALEQKGQLVSISAQALQNAEELERLKSAHEKEFGSLPTSIQSPAVRRELETQGGLQVSMYAQSQTQNDDGDAVGDDGSSVATDSTMGQFPRPRRAAPTAPASTASTPSASTPLHDEGSGSIQFASNGSDVPKRATTLAELQAELAEGRSGGPRQLAREFRGEQGWPKYTDEEALHRAISSELNRANGSIKQAFGLFDTRGVGLDADELREALATCGLTCTDGAFEQLMTNALDPSFSGLLMYHDFVRAMLRSSSSKREEAAARAVDAIRHTHNAQSHATKTNEERLATYLRCVRS